MITSIDLVNRHAAVSLSLVAAMLLGCSGGTVVVKPPSIDAGLAAARAIETYDTNGDGLVAGDELGNAPSLRAAIETLDTNGDKQVSKEEIEARIRAWQSTRAGISAIRCTVTLNGRPLEGAMVTFEPEEFLGEELLAASDDTNSRGVASPFIPKENRPTPDMPAGIQLGLFKVKISKQVNGEETIPAKYNSETTLGQQVSRDDPAILERRVVFELKSR